MRAVPLVLLLADAAALLAAIAIAFLLRFEGAPCGQVYCNHVKSHLLTLPLAIAIYLFVFSAFRLYRYAWRFAGLEMVWGVIFANSIGLTGLATLQLLADGGTFPRSVLIIIWMMSILFIGGLRILLRLIGMSRRRNHGSAQACRPSASAKGAIILGGGVHGVRILKAIREDLGSSYRVIGFLDEDPQIKGMYISNVQVLGPLRLLYGLLTEEAVDEVIVALPEVGGRDIREYVLECRKRKVPVKVIPQMKDALNGKTCLRLEEFSVEDLLRRPPVSIDARDIGRHLTDKRVLVTGAGGSIGSELCRQILAFSPASLVLFGHGENSIFQIRQELVTDLPAVSDRVHWAIGSVSHRNRLEQVFTSFRPDVVFHAAAHKHVPIMEANVQEAVHNNVVGTHCVADACGRLGVERIVLISTDKAADPSSIMGATKWLCEEVIRAATSLWRETTYVSVRFGNVLGSRGSVVPLFREQIKHGGPVTVTHPDMTRYFMTIPEAVQLVLQAGTIGKSGELYVLDMGDPVKILDLARDMIQLSGFVPDADIPIVFTGVRPGERLNEQLVAENERIEKSPREDMSLVHRPDRFTPSELLEAVGRLEQLADHGSPAETSAYLNELIFGSPAKSPAPQPSLAAQPYGAAVQP